MRFDLAPVAETLLALRDQAVDPGFESRGHGRTVVAYLGQQRDALLRLPDVGSEIAGAGKAQGHAAGSRDLRTILCGGAVFALHHVEVGQGKPRLRVLRVAFERSLEQIARLGELMAELQDGGLQHHRHRWRRFLRHPWRDHGLGVARVVGIAELASEIDVRTRQLVGQRQVGRLCVQPGAQIASISAVTVGSDADGTCCSTSESATGMNGAR